MYDHALGVPLVKLEQWDTQMIFTKTNAKQLQDIMLLANNTSWRICTWLLSVGMNLMK